MSEESRLSPSCLSNIDTVSLNNLGFEIVAPNVWGQRKSQPALLSIRLELSDGFGTAASKDQLDQNTVNYGELAKNIRARCDNQTTLQTLFSLVETVIIDMGMRADGTCRLSQSTVRVKLPQASMYGQGVDFVDDLTYDKTGNSTLFEGGRTKEKTASRDQFGINLRPGSGQR